MLLASQVVGYGAALHPAPKGKAALSYTGGMRVGCDPSGVVGTLNALLAVTINYGAGVRSPPCSFLK